ncbi:MAG: hypothetical protein ACRDLP_10790 [Solirubrobacteraceae bacterium]
MLLGRAIRRIGPLGSAVIAYQLATTTRAHWKSIPREDRARLQSLLRDSHGKPSNLSKAERRELRTLVRALQLPRLVRDTALNAAGIRRQLRRPPD